MTTFTFPSHESLKTSTTKDIFLFVLHDICIGLHDKCTFALCKSHRAKRLEFEREATKCHLLPSQRQGIDRVSPQKFETFIHPYTCYCNALFFLAYKSSMESSMKLIVETSFFVASQFKMFLLSKILSKYSCHYFIPNQYSKFNTKKLQTSNLEVFLQFVGFT